MSTKRSKTYSLTFQGYLINEDELPANSGIYLVYVGQYNTETDVVRIKGLIYIGESKNDP